MVNKSKAIIGILTGGGDVPGLNPAIRAVTLRAISEGYKVIGIRRGWAGLVEMQRDPSANNAEHFLELTKVLHGEDVANRDALANPKALDWFAELDLG